MDQTIIGSFKLADFDCPFSYEKETEKIIVYTGTSAVTIPENIDIIIGQKYGMLNGGYTLYKLALPLSNDCMAFDGSTPKYVSVANQIRSVEYYIEDYQPGSKYTELRLQFAELNYFIPSKGRATIADEEIVISRIKETLCSFDIKFHGTDVTISFVTKAEGHTRVKTTVETISEVVLSFPETDDLEYVRGLYDIARSFFAFICNRRNIGLRRATLIGEFPAKKIQEKKIVDSVGHTIQKIHFSQRYLEPEEDNKQIAKTANWGLFSGRLPELFRLFSEETSESIPTVNENSVHHSIKYRNLIDLEQSLHITATFEYYARTLLPEMSSSSTLDFLNDLAVLLNGYISGCSGKKKKKAQKFMKSLSPQIALENKLQKAYDGYSSWKPLKHILAEWFGDDISGLAQAANSWRNELAHEKREYQPGVEVVNAIRCVEHINYCIVLRQAGYTDEQIKAIISEILIR